MPAVPASGWYVELDTPDGTVRPSVLDGAQSRPTLNGLPAVRIPVPRDEGWLALLADDQPDIPMRVWHDGDRKAIEILDDVEQEPDRSILVGRGGVELRERETRSYDRRLAHLAARDIVDQTSYGRNVDAPPTETRDDVEVQSASGPTDLEAALASPLAATDPIVTTGAGLQLAQACYLLEGEDGNRTSGASTVSDSTYSAGEGVSVPSGESVSWSVTPEYRWPSDHVNMAIRIRADQSSTFQVSVAGDTVEVGDGGPFTSGVMWFTDLGSGSVLAGGTASENEYGGGDLAAGTSYDAEIAVTGGNAIEVDCVAVYDDRFSWSFDDSVDADGYLSTPRLHPPNGYTIAFDDAQTAFNVVGGRVDFSLSALTGDDVVGLSNDQGASYNTATNPGTSFETTFSSVSSTLRWRITLAPRGTRDTASPTQGIFGQELESYTLYADLEEIPLLVDVQYDTSRLDILRQIADLSYSIWEVRHDGSGIVVEWTRPGQRTRDADDDVDDYSFRRSVSEQIKQLTVKGSALTVQGEEFTADTSQAVELDKDNIVPGSETVRDPSTGETFDAGSDYLLLSQNGFVSADPDGALVDGQTYAIDYRHRVQGSVATEDYTAGDREAVREVAGLVTDAACEQAARWALAQVDAPLDEATVTLARSERQGPLVEEVDLGALPTTETLTVNSVEQEPATVRLELGSRRSIDAVIGDLRSRIRATTQRV